jgi:ketosteroid isomerase-like protein
MRMLWINRRVQDAANVLVLALLIPALAAAQGAEQEVRAADARRMAAMVKGDTAALTELLAEDLTYTHSTGQVETRAQFVESIGSGKLRYLAIEPSEVAVRLYGEMAIVTGRADMKVSAQGREQAFPIRFTEVWVKRGGHWRMAAWQSTRIG